MKRQDRKPKRKNSKDLDSDRREVKSYKHRKKQLKEKYD